MSRDSTPMHLEVACDRLLAADREISAAIDDMDDLEAHAARQIRHDLEHVIRRTRNLRAFTRKTGRLA